MVYCFEKFLTTVRNYCYIITEKKRLQVRDWRPRSSANFFFRSLENLIQTLKGFLQFLIVTGGFSKSNNLGKLKY